jgi:hypothetical protein
LRFGLVKNWLAFQFSSPSLARRANKIRSG